MEEPDHIPTPKGIDRQEVERAVRRRKKCPYCAELIQAEAIVCRYCGRELGGRPTEKPASSGAKALATISIICGIIGLIVFGIPLGVVALACGIPALAMGAQGGKAGIILGIIDILLAIAILFLFSGSGLC